MAELINGTILAQSINQNIKNTIAAQGLTPGLAIILVGDDPASRLYVKLKKRAALSAGIEFHEYLLSKDCSESEVLETINFLNNDDSTHGIVVQLPLPDKFDEMVVVGSVDPTKDADGFHFENVNNLVAGKSTFEPALTKTILSLIALPEIPLEGKNAIIIANSDVFAKPLCYLLEKQNIAAGYFHPDDKSIKEKIGKSDIIVVAVGKKNFILDDDCKKDAIVIDVGINEDDGGISGDVEKAIYEKKSTIGWVTPVPGGVGPVTIAMLLTNVLELYIRKTNPTTTDF